MSYTSRDVPRLVCLLAEVVEVDSPDRVVEYVDAKRAWDRLPQGPHRSMLWSVCALDKTMTNAAMRAGLYPARARVVLEEAAALMVFRLNNKEIR